jgi:S-adenosylmethionine hydrolase
MTRRRPAPRPLTLASDFGSPYPAAMKGVIRRRTDAELVDVSHDLPRGDPQAAAFWLRFVLAEFPPAVHCVVVDPGVGTDRAAVAVRAGAHVIVAPDNGLALPPARALAAGDHDPGADTDPEPDEAEQTRIDVYRIEGFDPASATFHGRDVFAPAAADVWEAVVAGGEATGDLGATGGPEATGGETKPNPAGPAEVRERLDGVSWLCRTDEYADARIPEPTVRGDGEDAVVDGEVLVVDDFGNVITNVPGGVVEGRQNVRVNDEPVPVVATFAAVSAGERLVTVGSHGYVECDVNDGRGAAAFGLAPGDPVRFSFG